MEKKNGNYLTGDAGTTYYKDSFLHSELAKGK